MKRRNGLRDQSGSALLVVLIVALTGLVLLLVIFNSSHESSSSFRTSLSLGIDAAVATVSETVRNPTAWGLSAADPVNQPFAACLNDSSCLSLPETPVALRLADGTWLARSGSTLGFSPSGQRCSSFNLAEGSDDCPIRVELVATLTRTAGGSPPNIQLRTKISLSPRSSIRPLNTATKEGEIKAPMTLSDGLKCATARFRRDGSQMDFDPRASGITSSSEALHFSPLNATGEWGVVCNPDWTLFSCPFLTAGNVSNTDTLRQLVRFRGNGCRTTAPDDGDPQLTAICCRVTIQEI